MYIRYWFNERHTFYQICLHHSFIIQEEHFNSTHNRFMFHFTRNVLYFSLFNNKYRFPIGWRYIVNYLTYFARLHLVSLLKLIHDSARCFLEKCLQQSQNQMAIVHLQFPPAHHISHFTHYNLSSHHPFNCLPRTHCILFCNRVIRKIGRGMRRREKRRSANEWVVLVPQATF